MNEPVLKSTLISVVVRVTHSPYYPSLVRSLRTLEYR
jgi:hypothetical protein